MTTLYGLGIFKSLWVTLKHLFRPPITIQYPEERPPIASRFRGVEFVWLEDRCTGCATCAKACPHGVIEILTSKGPEGRWVVEKFDIDMGFCIVCGLCVEACPYDALHMGSSFEWGSYTREGFLRTKADFIASEKNPSAFFRPHFEKQPYNQALATEPGWRR